MYEIIKSGLIQEPRKRVAAEMSTTVRVAVGDYHLPFLTLMIVGENKYAVLHEKRCLPSPSKLGVPSRDYKVITVSDTTHKTLEHALESHQQMKGYHINPFSFIVGFCSARGLDLFETGVFEK